MTKPMTYTLIFIAVVLIGFAYSVKYGNKAKKEIAKFNQSENETEQNPYNDIRNLAFSVTAEQLGIQIPNDSIKVYGIISDIDMNGETVTIITYLSGDASIYLSSGGGFIGAGQHESVQKVTKEFVANGHFSFFKGEKFDKPDLPLSGHANFYFLSNMGQTKITESISKMENGKSEFSKLFADLNSVMTEIRLKSGE